MREKCSTCQSLWAENTASFSVYLQADTPPHAPVRTPVQPPCFPLPPPLTLVLPVLPTLGQRCFQTEFPAPAATHCPWETQGQQPHAGVWIRVGFEVIGVVLSQWETCSRTRIFKIQRHYIFRNLFLKYSTQREKCTSSARSSMNSRKLNERV